MTEIRSGFPDLAICTENIWLRSAPRHGFSLNCLPQGFPPVNPTHHFNQPNLHKALGKAVSSETSLDTKFRHHWFLPVIVEQLFGVDSDDVGTLSCKTKWFPVCSTGHSEVQS